MYGTFPCISHTFLGKKWLKLGVRLIHRTRNETFSKNFGIIFYMISSQFYVSLYMLFSSLLQYLTYNNVPIRYPPYVLILI